VEVGKKTGLVTRQLADMSRNAAVTQLTRSQMRRHLSFTEETQTPVRHTPSDTSMSYAVSQ